MAMQYMQYNPAWLEDQENPPTVDPTFAWTLQRLAAVLGMQGPDRQRA